MPQYAWPNDDTIDRTNIRNRIDASKHRNELAVCCFCGKLVESVCNEFGVWEWSHTMFAAHAMKQTSHAETLPVIRGG